jgi:outer membrane lipoprotein LolB
MPNQSHHLALLFILSSIFLSGCATKPNKDTSTLIVQQTAEQRKKQLSKMTQWHLRGKIAFIEQVEGKKGKRESATISWKESKKNQTQELNLTSYLGINVLHLSSKNDEHLIKVNGKEYRTKNLEQLIFSLTGLTLPTRALSFWLKGLPYLSSDQIKASSTTQLPISLTSLVDDIQWQIDYKNYKVFNGLQMATQFTLMKDGLLIKVAVKEWSLTN